MASVYRLARILTATARFGGRSMASDIVTLVETPTERVKEIVATLRETVHSQQKGLNRAYRINQLQQLKRLIEENGEKICEGLHKDLHRDRQASFMLEINGVLSDISSALGSLDKWAAATQVDGGLLHMFNYAYIKPEPYGLALIISPWNYPFSLAVQPLVGAIAAGNACVLKPSEMAVHTSNVIAELFPKYLDEEYYRVVTGGIEVSKEVLRQRFDYILYTGSSAVGKYVMKQAAEHLTPVTLELGGKTPVIVADDANIEVAGRRIVWGKCINSGQTCIAPDYVICSSATQDRLLQVFRATIREFYGEDPKESKDYERIINARHFQRVVSLIDASRDKVAIGGEADKSQLYVSPTVMANVTGEDAVMKEEIFGPVLPIVVVETVDGNADEAIKFINEREKPLALYVFTERKQTLERIVERTSAGGVTHNDTLLHYSVPTFPFGGVGQSGTGSYHGKFSFDAFSHFKPVLSTATAAYLEGVNNVRYPPYSDAKLLDAQSLQLPPTGWGSSSSKFLHLAYLATSSVLGRPPYQQRND